MEGLLRRGGLTLGHLGTVRQAGPKHAGSHLRRPGHPRWCPSSCQGEVGSQDLVARAEAEWCCNNALIAASCFFRAVSMPPWHLCFRTVRALFRMGRCPLSLGSSYEFPVRLCSCRLLQASVLSTILGEVVRRLLSTALAVTGYRHFFLP